MISRAAAYRCAWSRKTSTAFWWRGNELDNLGADPDRRGPQRRRAIAAQGGDPAAGSFLGFQQRYARQQLGDLVQEPAVLDRHGVLRGERVRVAGRAVQSAGEHRLSDVVVGLRGGCGRVGDLAGREHGARQGARYCVDLRRCDSRVQEFNMKPFLPFTRPSIDDESIAAVADVFRSGQLASGPKVKDFEGALAAYLGGNRHVRVMTSATAGLEMALEVAGIGPGHEVIVPAMSFAASANVVARLRAKPVFVDIDLATRNLDLGKVPAAITAKTRAIMPVHFAGLPVHMERLYKLAAEHGLRGVEDAAHAIGSRYGDKPIGSFGDLVVFSFHPNKNMTTIEGGAISTGDAMAAELIEQSRFP